MAAHPLRIYPEQNDMDGASFEHGRRQDGGRSYLAGGWGTNDKNAVFSREKDMFSVDLSKYDACEGTVLAVYRSIPSGNIDIMEDI
jgi:hypothetical protein